MSKRKAQYIVGLDYPPEKQSRLRRLIGAWGYKSARGFIVEAIEEKIEAGLKSMTPEARTALEKIAGQQELS